MLVRRIFVKLDVGKCFLKKVPVLHGWYFLGEEILCNSVPGGLLGLLLANRGVNVCQTERAAGRYSDSSDHSCLLPRVISEYRMSQIDFVVFKFKVQASFKKLTFIKFRLPAASLPSPC